MVERLKQSLCQLLQVEGINAVALLSDDGFIIESVGSLDSDIESLGLIIAAMGPELRQQSGLIEVNKYILKTPLLQAYKVLMRATGEEIVALVAEPQANTKNIRL